MSSVARSAAPATSASENRFKVPILSASKQTIIDVSHQRSMSLAPLKAALECDPAASLNLFSKINVNLKRLGKPPVSDISRAILFMGFPDLVSDVRASVALEDVVEADQVPDLLKLLNRAHYASRQTRTIGELVGGFNPDEIQAASLTQTALGYVDAVGELGAAKTSPDLLLGLLPQPGDGDAETSRQILSLGSRFADATISAWDETTLDPLYEEIAAVTRRPADEVSRRMKQTAVVAARIASHYQPFASARLLMMSGPAISAATAMDEPVVTTVAKKTTSRQESKSSAPSKRVEKTIKNADPSKN